MTANNKLTMTVAAALLWGSAATFAQIPSGIYSNTFSGTAALYDPSGTHTQEISGIRLEFTLNMDSKGKLTGDGVAIFTNGTTNDVGTSSPLTCNGAMKSFKKSPRASFTLKIKGSGGNGTIKEDLDPDPSNQQLAGTAKGNVSTGPGKSGKQKISASGVALNLPIGADGSWTLEVTVAQVGNKYTGNGTLEICSCKTYSITVSGNLSRQGGSKLVLKGDKGSINLTLGASAGDGELLVQSMKGKALGQTPHIP